MLTGYQANDVTLAVAEGDLVFAAGVLYFTQQQGGLLLGRSRVQVDQTTPDARELLMADDSPQAPDGGLLDRDWPRFRVYGLRTSGHQPDARQLRPATLRQRLDQVHNRQRACGLLLLQGRQGCCFAKRGIQAPQIHDPGERHLISERGKQMLEVFWP